MKVDIMGVGETKWSGCGKIYDNKKTIVYAGGEQHKNGLGVVMSERASNSMLGFWPMSDRVILVKLQGKPMNINIIQAYAPTTDHEDEEIESFYEEISTALKQAKCGEAVILMGDLNAKNRIKQKYNNRKTWTGPAKRERAKTHGVL